MKYFLHMASRVECLRALSAKPRKVIATNDAATPRMRPIEDTL